MEYDSAVLRKLQKCELDILKYFIGICEKYKINWFAVYGTALGTIRHHGFIPWDDDIDVGMLREDFERFKEAIKKEKDSQYELIDAAENEGFHLLFCKLQLKNTKFIQTSFKPKYNTGIFIDIFIFDAVSEVERERNSQIASAKFWHLLFVLQRIPKPDLAYKNCLRKYAIILIHILIHLIIRLLHIKEDYFYKKFMKAALRYKGKETNMVAVLSSSVADKYLFYKDDIFPTVTATFGDIHIKMAAKSDKMLKSWYGDFMKLPPLEERKTHSPSILRFPNGEELRFK